MTSLFLLGTRPEAIKLAPVIYEFIKNKKKILVYFTGQHEGVVSFIQDLYPEIFNLNNFQYFTFIDSKSYLQEDRILNSVETRISYILGGIFKFLSDSELDYVLVQGDTLSAFLGALYGFHYKIPVCHIEAGLRTFNLKQPFPEEGYRQMISRIATYHFCPTQTDRDRLNSESLSRDRFLEVVGNSVIDSLKHVLGNKKLPKLENYVLVTFHRSENKHYLKKFEFFIAKLAAENKDLNFIWFVHPSLKNKMTLSCTPNLDVTKSVGYREMIEYLSRAKMVVTDSGGIQEECCYLGIQAIVLRNFTERPNSCTVLCKGDSFDEQLNQAYKVFQGAKLNSKRMKYKNTFGDGLTSSKIYNCLFSK